MGPCPTALVSTCSRRISARQVRGCLGIQYRAARRQRTCGTGLFDLQSADWCCNLQSAYQTAVGLYPWLFYKESTLFFGFYSGFTRGEYHVIRVDFIVALRRTKGRGRRTLRSPPSPSSGLHLIHPGCPLRRGMTAAAGLCQYWIPVSGAVAYPQFRIWFGCLCSGLDRSRFSRVVGLVSHVFHYWGDRLFVPAATWGFCFFFRRICADRDWVVCFVW